MTTHEIKQALSKYKEGRLDFSSLTSDNGNVNMLLASSVIELVTIIEDLLTRVETIEDGLE